MDQPQPIQSSSPASSSPGSSPATQPETQESTLSQPTVMTQQPQPPQPATQPFAEEQQQQATTTTTTTAPPLSLTQMTTEHTISQLLVTQPNTQVENSQWGEEGNFNYNNDNDQPITQPLMTQPITQPFGSDAMNIMSEIIATSELHDGDPGKKMDDVNNEGGAIAMNEKSNVAKNNDGIGGEAGMEEAVAGRNEQHNESGDIAMHVQKDDDMQPLALQHAATMPMMNANDYSTTKNADTDCGNGTSTNTTTATTTTPHLQTKRTVTNPYAKNNKKPPPPLLAKRSIDQISNANSSATSSSSSSATSAINPARKQVFNPYAKLPNNKQTPKQQAGVRNPYAKIMKSAPINPSTKNTTTATQVVVQTKTPVAVAAAAATTTTSSNNQPPPPPPPQFRRRAGISISLPMAERLPSRNVSYQPAEILTVGELYRYLYCHNATTTDDDDDDDDGVSMERESARGATSTNEETASTSKELISVRITGTLLCVTATTSNHPDGVRAADLYNSGTFLLVGDPLENTRFLKKEIIIPPKKQSECKPTSTTAGVAIATPKVGLTSILRNKKTPSAPMISVRALTTARTSTAAKESSTVPRSAAAAAAAAATPAMMKPMNNEINNKASSAITSKNKSMNRGILNTNKKKKLVYNGGGGGGKRLSFGGGIGGKGSGGGGIGGGLLGRKFVTPKRVNLNSSVGGVGLPSGGLLSKRSANNKDLTNRVGGLSSSTVMMKKRTVPFSSIKPIRIRGTFTSCSNGKNNNTRSPDYIIQRHPSPIVPVWIGSYYSGDGLDGAVVGDLVMIMGEIVIKHCASCCQKNISSADENEDDDDQKCVDNDKGNDGDENTIEASSSDNADEIMDINAKEDVVAQPSQQSSHKSPSSAPATTSKRIQCVNDAADSIAAYCASSSSSSRIYTKNDKSRSFCGQCTRFLRARFVKNANGTDMSLQKEALHARRAYLAERRRMQNGIGANQQGLYSVGCGLPI